MVSLSDEDIRSRSFDYNIVKRFMPYVSKYKRDVFIGFFFILLLTFGIIVFGFAVIIFLNIIFIKNNRIKHEQFYSQMDINHIN